MRSMSMRCELRTVPFAPPVSPILRSISSKARFAACSHCSLQQCVLARLVENWVDGYVSMSVIAAGALDLLERAACRLHPLLPAKCTQLLLSIEYSLQHSGRHQRT